MFRHRTLVMEGQPASTGNMEKDLRGRLTPVEAQSGSRCETQPEPLRVLLDGWPSVVYTLYAYLMQVPAGSYSLYTQ